MPLLTSLLLLILRATGAHALPIPSHLSVTFETRLVIACLPEAGPDEWIPPSPDHPRGDIHWACRELQRRIESGRLSDRQLRRAIEQARVLRTRRSWPVGVPASIELICPFSWGITRVEVRPEGNHDVPFSLGYYRDLNTACSVGVIHGTSKNFMVTVAFNGLRADWTGRIAVPVETVPDEDAAVPPVDELAIAAALRGNLRLVKTRVCATCFPSRPQPPCPASSLTQADLAKWHERVDLGFLWERNAPDALQGLAAFLRFELIPPTDAAPVEIGKGSLYRQCSFLPPHYGVDLVYARCHVASTMYNQWADIPADELKNWKIRVTGFKPDRAKFRTYILNDLGADRYWTGAVDVPLSDLIQPPGTPQLWEQPDGALKEDPGMTERMREFDN